MKKSAISILVLISAIAAFAQAPTASVPQKSDKATPVAQVQSVKKIVIVHPPRPSTNWSKIKDLFM